MIGTSRFYLHLLAKPGNLVYAFPACCGLPHSQKNDAGAYRADLGCSFSSANPMLDMHMELGMGLNKCRDNILGVGELEIAYSKAIRRRQQIYRVIRDMASDVNMLHDETEMLTVLFHCQYLQGRAPFNKLLDMCEYNTDE